MITAKMVQELREKTGAGMMDCKKALTAADGDMEMAIENLRKSGITKAAKKSGRSTNQGKVWTASADGSAVIVEVLCETDFAAKTDKFGILVKEIASGALKVAGDGDVSEAVNAAEKELLTSHIATIGENMQIRRAVKWVAAPGGSFGFYHHMDGRISVMIESENEADPAFLKEICMHIAVSNPTYITSKDVPAEVIAKEKEIALANDPKLQGKPAAMLDKILDGKVQKFFADSCLVNQPWIMDDKTTLAKLRPNLKIRRIIRWAVGEEL